MNALDRLAQAQVPSPPESGRAEMPTSMLFFGVLLIGVSIAGMRFVRWVADVVSPRPPEVRAPWRLPHVVLVALTLFLGGPVVVMIAGNVGGDVLRSLYLTAALVGVGALAALGIAARYGPSGLAALGLRATGNVRAAFAAMMSYVVFVPAFIGSGIVWAVSLKLLGHDVQEQDIMSGFQSLSPGERLVPFLTATLLQPLFEEVLFRGFLQPVLVDRMRATLGILVTSILFGALHGFDPFLPIFALSLLLGWVRERTQSLGACWLVHALHNTGTLFIVFFRPEWLEPQSHPGMLFS